MSTGKLDQSLDDIMKNHRSSNRRGRGGRRGPGRPAPTHGPVGGVHKNTKQGKQGKAIPTAPAAAAGGSETKIMISNLPQDLDEQSLKDYFVQADIGNPKKILLQYGPTGRSLGSATVIFYKPEQATKATKELDNARIDGRPVRVEVLISAAKAPAPAPKPSLADRISGPKKDKPKPATTEKPKAAGGRGRGRGRGRGGRNPRGPRKTMEELDAEMEDYFPTPEGGNDAMVTNGGQVNGAVDTAMDDEML
ncbi:RNA-binding domain-containing protein [Lojkania enalia]|uniref:RNA-binding domain-containing protein n=1 Tax=Lojkania enalia TaxID=147567 RepID=A0A9P4N8X0_9PLEO|nr:RNA-binding domain-containing protein [Didymosphaeria enalia]